MKKVRYTELIVMYQELMVKTEIRMDEEINERWEEN